MTLPRIAIPEPTSTDRAYNQRSLPQYIHAVVASGGTAVPIPLNATVTDWAGILASCSGVLLPGSPADVDPARYGQDRVKECAAKDEAREAVDNLLLQGAFDQGKPILGICYGLQSLNVWRQGTLIQHLSQDLPHDPLNGLPNAHAATTGKVNHQPGREVQKAHPVLVTPGSRLSNVVKAAGEEVPGLFVNSSHHQAIGRPGKALVVAATSPDDGVIEALESPDPNQFVVAVQWHPERSYDVSPASRALFAAFLDAARQWAASPKVDASKQCTS
jgi:putative glutamine amidotransferase